MTNNAAENKARAFLNNLSEDQQVDLIRTYNTQTHENQLDGRKVDSLVFNRLVNAVVHSGNNKLQGALIEHQPQVFDTDRQYTFFYNSSSQTRVKFIDTLGENITPQVQQHLAHFGDAATKKALADKLSDDIDAIAKSYLPQHFFAKAAPQVEEIAPTVNVTSDLQGHAVSAFEREEPKPQQGYAGDAFAVA